MNEEHRVVNGECTSADCTAYSKCTISMLKRLVQPKSYGKTIIFGKVVSSADLQYIVNIGRTDRFRKLGFRNLAVSQQDLPNMSK